MLLLSIILVGLGIAENLDAFALFEYSLRRILQISLIIIGFALFFKLLILDLKSKNIITSALYDINLIIILSIIIWAIIRTLYLCDSNFEVCFQDKFYLNRLIHWSLIIPIMILIYYSSIKLPIIKVNLIISKITLVATILAVFYIIDFILVRYEFDVIHRNNIGTSGGVIYNRLYYYEFHRLMGGFREPSHAGAFMLIALSLTYGDAEVFKKLILSTALMLTGSIIIFIIYIGLIFFWLTNDIIKKNSNHIKLTIFSIFLGFLLANSLTFKYESIYTQGVTQESYVDKRLSLVNSEVKKCEILDDRIQSIKCIIENIPGRGYVFSYFLDAPINYLGVGLVLPYYELKDYINSEHIIPSFLSSIVILYQFGIFLIVLILIVFFNTFIKLMNCVNNCIGVKLSSALFVIFFILALLIEEPNFFMIAIISLSFGVAHCSKYDLFIFQNHKSTNMFGKN